MKTSLHLATLRRAFAAVLAALSFTTDCAAAPPQYTVLDLGALVGNDSFATGVNDLGMVTGWFEDSSEGAHAFLYAGGVMHDLGSVPRGTSYGNGLNNHGQVVGNHAPPAFSGDLPFLADTGAFTPSAHSAGRTAKRRD